MSDLFLDLGCGVLKIPGYVGVDRAALDGVDVVHDLDVTPWPFEDDSVQGIHCSHLVEHVRDLLGFMAECWRILRNEATLEIQHPYQFNVRAWQDPTHVRALNEISWFYFDKKWRGDEHRPEFGEADFELVELDAIPEENWKGVAEEQPDEFERAARNQINVVSDLRVVLQCRKSQ